MGDVLQFPFSRMRMPQITTMSEDERRYPLAMSVRWRAEASGSDHPWLAAIYYTIESRVRAVGSRSPSCFIEEMFDVYSNAEASVAAISEAGLPSLEGLVDEIMELYLCSECERGCVTFDALRKQDLARLFAAGVSFGGKSWRDYRA